MTVTVTVTWHGVAWRGMASRSRFHPRTAAMPAPMTSDAKGVPTWRAPFAEAALQVFCRGAFTISSGLKQNGPRRSVPEKTVPAVQRVGTAALGRFGVSSTNIESGLLYFKG